MNIKGAVSLSLPIILSVILIFGVAYYSGLLGSISGFTTLSLTKASFTSSSSYFSEPTWILSVVQGGLGQSATGVIDNEQIGSESGKTPANDFKLTLDYSTQSCEFSIKESSDVLIKEYTKVVEWSCLSAPSLSTAESKCGSTVSYYGKYSDSLTCFCVVGQNIARTGYIETPIVHTVTKITASNGKSSDSKTFDTKGSIKDFVGSNVYVIWNGYLIKDACSGAEDKYVFYKEGSWKVGFKSYYDNYKSAKISFDTVAVGSSITKSQLMSAINNINYWADKAVTSVSFGSISNPASLTSAMIVKDVSLNNVAMPLWTFYVKASWLGIYQPSPSPQIVSVSSSAFSSSGQITAVIKNNGESGNIDVWAECQSPIVMSGNTIMQFVDSGMTKNYYIKLSASSSSATTKTCTVYAQALDKKVSKSLTITLNPVSVCQANVKQCASGEKIQQCNSYGSGWVLVEDCASKNMVCSYDSFGAPICKSNNNTVVSCAWWDLSCQLSKAGSNLNDLFNIIIKLVIILIIVFIIWMVISMFFPMLPNPYQAIRHIRR